MKNIEIIIPLIITLYTALGFLASKKYDKFDKMLMPMFILIGSFILISFTWDISAIRYSTSLISDIDCSIPKKTIENHSFGYIYMTIIPFITFWYLFLLDYIFKPD